MLRREPRPFTVEVRRSRVPTARAKAPVDVSPEFPIDDVVDDLPVVDVRRDEVDDEYEQAMRAADKVFSRLAPVVPPVLPKKEPEPLPPPAPEPKVEQPEEPVVQRRILPSLLERPEDPVAARLREHEEQKREARKRKPRQAKPKPLPLLEAMAAPASVEIEATTEEIASPAEEIATVAPEPELVERVAEEIATAEPVAEAPTQARRTRAPRTSYKDNWTYYKEALMAPTRNSAEVASLRPGERWKRRLTKYAW